MAEPEYQRAGLFVATVLLALRKQNSQDNESSSNGEVLWSSGEKVLPIGDIPKLDFLYMKLRKEHGFWNQFLSFKPIALGFSEFMFIHLQLFS